MALTQVFNPITGKFDLINETMSQVREYANLAAFPAIGESNTVYIALDTNLTYRWGGTVYVEVSPSLALGTTGSTAFRGDLGQTAYNHSQATGNPHGATTADISDSANKRYTTEAQQTILGNTSGTNSGDETNQRIGNLINGATDKATPIDADMVGLMDSAAGNILKKLSWLNIKATLKTYFDTLYSPIGGSSLPQAWTAWTPTLGGMTLGNGTLACEYVVFGKTCHFRFLLTLGTTSSVTGNIRFSLPVAPSDYTTVYMPVGTGLIRFSGSSSSPITSQYYDSTSIITYLATSPLSSPNTGAYAAGSVVSFIGTYETM